MTTDAVWHVPGSPSTRIMGEEIKEAIVNQDYIATVVTAIFANALACMVNLYAPHPTSLDTSIG